MIFGVIPLDKVLHFLIGMLITIVLRWRKVSINKILLLIFILELIKETHDSFVLNNTMEEHILDALVTFLYPALIWVIIKIKSSANTYSK